MALDPRDPILRAHEDKGDGDADPRDPILYSQEDKAAAAAPPSFPYYVKRRTRRQMDVLITM